MRKLLYSLVLLLAACGQGEPSTQNQQPLAPKCMTPVGEFKGLFIFSQFAPSNSCTPDNMGGAAPGTSSEASVTFDTRGAMAPMTAGWNCVTTLADCDIKAICETNDHMVKMDLALTLDPDGKRLTGSGKLTSAMANTCPWYTFSLLTAK